ncbi:MAG: hypothetical protein EBU08_01245 [Micrococcales bacterium]|nr:hypothetical protein [Micrococcales bacterium]
MGQVTENPTYDIEVGAENAPEVQVDIDDEGKAEIVEDLAPEPDKPALAEPVDKEPVKEEANNQGEELKEYSDTVKKRIDKLTSKLREAERREQAALEFAKGVQGQFQQAQQRAATSDYGRLAEAKSRVDTQLLTIRQIIKKAREEGDIDTETEAQERLASLAHEQRELAGYLERGAEQPQAQIYNPPIQPQQIYQQPQFQPPAQQAPRVDPKAESWAEENPWFGQDTTMTYAAWGIDKQLREAEGFDGSSDEYYDELNRRIKAQFPQKFAAQPNRQQRQPVQAVAPAARSSGVNTNARRSVRLSPSQVAIAKKLGVPIEEYAKYVKE